MFEVGRFIECVKEKPLLWDKALKDYSDKNNREMAWIEIGEKFHEDWDEFDVKQQEEKVREMKLKWRHIRDCFVKSVRGPASKRRKYIYSDSLLFLLNTAVPVKRKNSAHSEDDEEDKYGERGENEDDDEDDVGEGIGASDNNNDKVKLPKAAPRQRKIATRLLYQKEIRKKLESSKREEEDADKVFLMSLLPEYKQLDEEEKIDFKLLTLQFFRSIRRKQTSQNMQPGFFTPSPCLPNMNGCYHFQVCPHNMQIPTFAMQPIPNAHIPSTTHTPPTTQTPTSQTSKEPSSVQTPPTKDSEQSQLNDTIMSLINN